MLALINTRKYKYRYVKGSTLSFPIYLGGLPDEPLTWFARMVKAMRLRIGGQRGEFAVNAGRTDCVDHSCGRP